MSAIKLSDLQKGADEKYPDFEIEIEDGKVVAFQPILRLDKKGRKAVVAALDIAKRFGSEESDEDWTDVYADAFKLTARTPQAFTAVKKFAGEDLTRWSYLFDQYQEKTHAGEA
ncbi:phage tail assembly protein [Arthrobacter sp. ISL-95]|uniref:phage tail assembly protein n=1 Tax=Arthrobacter sp. ISL-95 TaxID=2819116 RepID=UPI001BEAE25D|nr:phage tail assembly protein [Arthrobacter sp. ISL-95]MBT2587951.1 phage tail assembly protein [Arthrobacter sp. ISL-95]